MAQEELLVNALVMTARNDIRRGVKREEILRSLSSLISRELFLKVLERL